jgi:branched-chain amino acid transport system ATP-binding protein
MVGRIHGCDPIRSLRQAKKGWERILEFIGLSEKGMWRASALGVVDRRKLETARALATKPKLLLLDEMMAGLTPTELRKPWCW